MLSVLGLNCDDLRGGFLPRGGMRSEISSSKEGSEEGLRAPTCSLSLECGKGGSTVQLHGDGGARLRLRCGWRVEGLATKVIKGRGHNRLADGVRPVI